MDIYWKVIAVSFLTIEIVSVLRKQSPDIAMLLTLLLCCFIVGISLHYLSTILDFLQELIDKINIDADLMEVLLKVVGLGIVSELSSLLCADSCNSAVGKSIQILSGILVLWLTLPLLRTLLELLIGVLEGI